MCEAPARAPAASQHKHTPTYSDNSNSSSERHLRGQLRAPVSWAGARGAEEDEPGARAAVEPALSAGVPGGTTWAEARQKQAPRSHNGQTACGAATVRGRGLGCGRVDPGERREGGV